MAENKQRAKGTPFVAKVVKDPAALEATRLLLGFLGESAKEEHTRLYLDSNLSNYLDLPNDQVLHVHELSPGDYPPFGGAYLWVHHDAELTYESTAPSNPNESAQNEQGTPPVHTYYHCPVSHTPNCPTVAPACQPLQAQTITTPAFCPVATHGANCVTFTPTSCGNAAVGQADAVWPTVLCPTIIGPNCVVTRLPIICANAQASRGATQQPQVAQAAQADAIWPTVFGPNCVVTRLPIICANAQAGQGATQQPQVAQAAQADAFWPTVFGPNCVVTHLPFICANAQAGQGATQQPQAYQGAQGPAAYGAGFAGGQANAPATFPTFPVSVCASIPIVCC